MNNPDVGKIDRKIEEALVAMHRAITFFQFYPKGDPALKEVLQKGYETYLEIEGDSLLENPGIAIAKNSMKIGDLSIGKGNPSITHLAKLLVTHSIRKINRRSVLGPDGYEALLNLMAAAPELVSQKGGLEYIWKRSPYNKALEFDFGEAEKQPAENPRKRDANLANDWGTSIAKKDQAIAFSNPKIVGRLQALQHRGEGDRKLLDLLLGLGSITDGNALGRSLDDVCQSISELVRKQNYRTAYQIVMFLYREARNLISIENAEFGKMITSAIRSLVKGPFLKWITMEMSNAKGHEEAEIGEYILRLAGRGSVVYLINALATERSTLGRRRLVSVLVSIGKPVVPYAKKMLDDQRWYVVRNMVSVLGGIGDEAALDAILKLSADPDPRIITEVVRALGKIETAEAEAGTIRFVHHPDSSIRNLAVNALSMHASPTAMNIMWDIYDSTKITDEDWEVKVSVVEGMGKMPFEHTVKRLGDILTKMNVRNKNRWDRVQMGAIFALGELGGDEVEEFLYKATSHRTRDVKTAADRALAALLSTK